MGFQRRSRLSRRYLSATPTQNNLLGSVAVGGRCAFRLAASLYGLRLPLPLYRQSRKQIPTTLPRCTITTSIRWHLNIRGITQSERGRTPPSDIESKTKTALLNILTFPPSTRGQRFNQDAYLQQQFTLGRLSVIAGGRFVHSSAYGNTGVPRVALTLLALRGGEFFLEPDLRFSYATAFMEPDLPDFCGSSLLCSQSRPVTGAHARIRSRDPAEFSHRPLGPECNLL